MKDICLDEILKNEKGEVLDLDWVSKITGLTEEEIMKMSVEELIKIIDEKYC